MLRAQQRYAASYVHRQHHARCVQERPPMIIHVWAHAAVTLNSSGAHMSIHIHTNSNTKQQKNCNHFHSPNSRLLSAAASAAPPNTVVRAVVWVVEYRTHVTKASRVGAHIYQLVLPHRRLV